MNVYLQGLQVGLLGLAITFLALGGFILVIVALKRLFPASPPLEQEQPPDETPADEGEGSNDEGAVVAAIALALARKRAAGSGQLGEALTRGRGPWWNASPRGDRRR